MGNITNKAQKYLLNNKCADLLLNDNRTTRIEDRIYVSDIMMMFLRSEREQKDSEQQSNCNLPQVSNLVCPTHGTMLYKHTNGLAYCSFCTYSVSWQTGC